MTRPTEETAMHTRLLKCALEVDDARAFWARVDPSTEVTPQRAFDEYWFGARSMARIKVLLANMRARFTAFPSALDALHRWPHMAPDTRRAICHWHLQLADPLYRAFTGAWLVERRESGRVDITRDRVVAWVGEQGPGRWTMSTRVQFASKLLSAAFAAGLVGGKRDPRPVTLPRVTDDALEYLMYLLREVTFAGTLLDNPYARSLGLDPQALIERLRSLPGLDFKRQGELVDFGWRRPDLGAWADARFGPAGAGSGPVDALPAAGGV